MRLSRRKCIKLCCYCVILWILYVIISHIIKQQHHDNNWTAVSDVVHVLPSRILQSVHWDSTSIPVVIVEEHHEVIPYWFAAAESGLISKNGVTVVHVDGHPDTGFPILTDNFPLFKWPKTMSQLYILMQKNDVFVVGAALTGMINRFIWVWPPWDHKNHEDDHVTMFVDIGSAVKWHDGESVMVLCVCCVSLELDKECYMSNYTHDDTDLISIQESECSFTQNVSGIYEEVSEKKAIQLMKSEIKWIDASEEVILDIDEDYYGCESVVNKLYRARVKSEVIVNLQHIIHDMFCGFSVQQEISADEFFHSIIKIVTDLKLKMCNQSVQKDKQNQCLTYVRIQQILFGMIPNLIERLSGDDSCLCDEDQLNNIFLQGLMRNMLALTPLQLTVLNEVGVCLPGSAKTVGYEPEMRLCLSYNTPNSTLVTFHSPTYREIQKRTKALETLFSHSNILPKFVTVTRSVRDGYTPRDQSFKIESDLIAVLRHSFSGVDKKLVHFDNGLLGGQPGWYGRYTL